MSAFLFRLGRSCARHPYRTLLAWLLVAASVLGAKTQFGGELHDDFTVPGAESQHGTDVLKARFPEFSGAASRVVFHTEDGRLDDAAHRSLVADAVGRLGTVQGVSLVTDPFAPRSPTLSADGRTAYATVRFTDQSLSKDQYDESVEAITPTRDAGVQTELSGDLAQAGKEIQGNEAIGIAVAIVVLLLAFGSVVAMGLPIVTALLGVGVATFGVGIYASLTDVPTVSRMLAVMIGLGVGIDYALFVVTRHRQHLHEGLVPAEAAGRATATAGQSVLFAGTTVCIAIFGLLLAAIPAITAIGVAIGIAVISAMAIAVTLLPGLLGLAGRRIDSLAIHHKQAHDRAHETLSGKWAHHVGRRPWRYAIGTFVLLAVAAVPVLDMRIGFSDDSNEAKGSTARQSYELLTESFGPGFSGVLDAVIELPNGDVTAASRVHDAVAATSGVASVAAPVVSKNGETAIVSIVPTTSPQDEATSDLVHRLRHDVLPAAVAGTGATTQVTGQTALQEDVSSRLSDRLPIFMATVVGLSFILLMIVFRSVFVPLKAAVMNLLSIGAAYGAIIAVFQWGWAKSLFGLEDTVPVNPFVPLMMFAILFGLSMDYEVFLLSRVREEFQRTGDTHGSVIEGLGSTARVITSAALIMISIFGAFIWTDDVVVKMFGLGLAVAVLIDATLVRMVLVPATMALLGNANWWLPRWLDRILPHLTLEDAATGATTDEGGQRVSSIAA